MIPRRLSVQQIAGMKKDVHAYEAQLTVLQGVNDLIANLEAGDAVQQGDIVLSAGLGSTAVVSSLTGTFKRARFTVTVQGTGIAANPKITLNFPSGLWETKPFAQVVRNGGTGTLGHSWDETA